MRAQRPVFINGNPLVGTYKRNYEGDYRCSEAEVRQMLRDAGEEPQDARLLPGFDLADLDQETLKAFRQRFSSREPDHPFLALDDKELLYRLGGWRSERSSSAEGLTLAGLLMFGRERSLLDALPHFHLDYQERRTKNPEERWTYRLTIDGRWEPNLFNFYFRVYPRLVDGLNVPFKLDREAVRFGETHVHEALREALVNTLIHADHQSSRAVTIVKEVDGFVFTNPGRLRIPRDVLYQGGVSDPRNPSLQKMFQMLGLGEKAGSGFQKILRAWREQHWLVPLVMENAHLEMTRIWLPLSSMVPEEVEKELREVVGDAYSSLSELDRMILVLAHRFGEVGNVDVQPYRREHPREIGERLKYLADHGWLSKSGQGRGTRYRLSGTRVPDLLGSLVPGSGHYAGKSGHYEEGSGRYEPEPEESDARLAGIAAPVRGKGRAPKELVEQTIEALCEDNWLSLRTLAKLLDRDAEALRKHYVTRMVREGRLVARFADYPNRPDQAYQTKK